MGQQRVFDLMETFLKEKEYPLIHTMNPEEIADIFHKSNRCFLVSWLLKLLKYDALEELLFEEEDNPVLLSSLVCGYGFCSQKQKLGFINGDLPVEEQVRIIFRMCKFINQVGKSPKQADHPTVPVENISQLIHKDLNLFPQYGPIKTLSEEQKAIKKKELQIELETLQNLPEKEESKISHSKLKLKTDINEVVDNLDQMLNDVRTVEMVIKQGRYCSRVKYKTNSEAGDIIATCSKHIDTLSQHITDLKLITDFSEENYLSDEKCIYTEMISALFQQTKEQQFSKFGRHV